MAKVKLDPDHIGIYLHECPGCGHKHVIPTKENQGYPIEARWDFNNNVDQPTFSPSILNRTGKYVPGNESWVDEGGISSICHYFIREGRIEYCGDCTHSLAGKTVDLPDIN